MFEQFRVSRISTAAREKLLSGGYYSQVGQDLFLHRFFGNTEGFFVDIGAHDGLTFSNSFFFEKNLNWKGICIEANPRVFADLEKNRTCRTLNVAVGPEAREANFASIQGYSEMLSGLESSYHWLHKWRIKSELKKYGGQSELITVQELPLSQIFEQENITRADFLSLDIEGGELEALKSIDFDNFRARVLIIENNYGASKIIRYLRKKEYFPIFRLGHDIIFLDQKY